MANIPMGFARTLTTCADIDTLPWQGFYESCGGQVSCKLPTSVRAIFEGSFGASLEHVSVIAGPETDERLAFAGVLAQAIDGATILLASQVLTMPTEVQLWLIGHELAHTVQLGRDGSDAEDVLEREAWDAADYALHGQRYTITGRGS